MERYTWSLRVGATDGGHATVFARKHQFRVGAPVHFDETYDAITALEYVLGVIGESGHPGLEKVGVKVYLATFEAEAEVRRLWQDMLATSPLVRTFQSAIRLELDLQVVM